MGLSLPPASTRPTADPFLAFPGESTQLAGCRGCTCASREGGRTGKGPFLQRLLQMVIPHVWGGGSGAEQWKRVEHPPRCFSVSTQESELRRLLHSQQDFVAPSLGWPGVCCSCLDLLSPAFPSAQRPPVPARVRAVWSCCRDSSSGKLEVLLHFRLFGKNPCYIKRKRKNSRPRYVPGS